MINQSSTFVFLSQGEPQLLDPYTRNQAIAFYGDERHATEFCEGQLLLMPGAALCFVDVPGTPDASRFPTADTLQFVEPNASPLQKPLFESFFARRPAALFIRKPGEAQYIFLGKQKITAFAFHPAGGIQSITFTLDPALPKEVWARYGGPGSS
jgi:hypothetical protein